MTHHRTSHLAEEAWKTDGSDVQVPFVPGDESICETVVLAIARRIGDAPARIPLLHDAVDVDALEALFDGRYEGTALDTVRAVSFRYADHLVRIYSTGCVTLTQLDDPGTSSGGATA
ncbi:HalOD1 output domain-containing protein [Halomarina salina]|uniref:HalOD1 output domain-containing protein n=1 Tax=Halomarina salina TaxID=1872699 RepID=A0ABD5RS78_9EURY|nr:HalOD1 output domain-containing protein [Halomarina salina]